MFTDDEVFEMWMLERLVWHLVQKEREYWAKIKAQEEEVKDVVFKWST